MQIPIDGAFVGNDVTSAKDLLVADALLREFLFEKKNNKRVKKGIEAPNSLWYENKKL